MGRIKLNNEDGFKMPEDKNIFDTINKRKGNIIIFGDYYDTG